MRLHRDYLTAGWTLLAILGIWVWMLILTGCATFIPDYNAKKFVSKKERAFLFLRTAPQGPQACTDRLDNANHPYRPVQIYADIAYAPLGEWVATYDINDGVRHFTFPPTTTPAWTLEYPAGPGHHTIKVAVQNTQQEEKMGVSTFSAFAYLTIYDCPMKEEVGG